MSGYRPQPLFPSYAWFALRATPGDGTAGLFRPGAIATQAGQAFEAAGAATGLR